MVSKTAPKQKPIIERPRLTSLLSQSAARTIVLVAPAGYGKTTLAEQWLARRRHAWLRVTSSLTDVAGLALGLADAANELVPDLVDRITEELRHFREQASDVHRIGAALQAELGRWPADAWLAIDDYHLAASDESDALIRHLVTSSPIQLLATSRARPGWTSARQILYGDTYEIGQARLAMTEEEAAEVLGRTSPTPAKNLVAVADGWPAVIGLAAMAGGSTPATDSLPETLYRFFTEELLQRADAALRTRFVACAIAPSLNRSTILTIGGDEHSSSRLIGQGVSVGILTERTGGSFEMNPLVRSFLRRDFAELDALTREHIATSIFDCYVQSAAWNDAYSVVETTGFAELLPKLVEASLDPVLSSGRVATLASWLQHGRGHRVRDPILDLAEAEIEFRRGHHGKAQAVANEAARQFDPRDPAYARARVRAGQAAYFNDLYEEAYESFRLAREVTGDPVLLRQAIWGCFLTTMDLERDGSVGFLRAFEELPDQSVEDVVRIATGRLAYGNRRSGLAAALAGARATAHLVERVDDPMIQTAFWNGYSGALMFSAEYEEAVQIAERGAADAGAAGLDFVLPHTRLITAQAYLGMGARSKAGRLIDELAADARRCGDEFLASNATTLRARMHIGDSRPSDAIAATETGISHPGNRATRGERLAVRALAFTMVGDDDKAVEAAEAAIHSTNTAATRVLAAIVKAVVSLPDRRSAELDHAVADAAAAAHLDMIVLAYRAVPNVLNAAHGVLGDERLVDLLARAHDEVLGPRVGLVSRPVQLATAGLSPREREVGLLLVEGRTNAEIASALFISEVTAKVHVRHILAKLGVRNRAEAAVTLTRELDRDA
jgi:LuxR family maltose regulon positive regulatory protein